MQKNVQTTARHNAVWSAVSISTIFIAFTV